MEKLILATILVALALVLYGCTSAQDNGNGAQAPPSGQGAVNNGPSSGGEQAGGAQAQPAGQGNGAQNGAIPPSQALGGQNANGSIFDNGTAFGGADLSNLSAADQDPAAGLIADEDIAGEPN